MLKFLGKKKAETLVSEDQPDDEDKVPVDAAEDQPDTPEGEDQPAPKDDEETPDPEAADGEDEPDEDAPVEATAAGAGYAEGLKAGRAEAHAEAVEVVQLCAIAGCSTKTALSMLSAHKTLEQVRSDLLKKQATANKTDIQTAHSGSGDGLSRMTEKVKKLDA